MKENEVLMEIQANMPNVVKKNNTKTGNLLKNRKPLIMGNLEVSWYNIKL